MDWSDHALWWPGSNKWLNKTRWTLEQYNITAGYNNFKTKKDLKTKNAN